MTWRRATAEDLPLAGLWALGGALAVLLAPWLPLLARAAPPCPLHALTGLPCLTCGATRAALALARGDVVTAIALNPLVAVAIACGALGGLLAPAWVTLGGPLPRLAAMHGMPSRVAAAIVLALDWAYLVARGV